VTRVLPALVQSLAAVAWGAVPIYFYATGLIARYLAPTFHLISLAGGLGMIVLGLFNLLKIRQAAPGCCDHRHDHDHDHHEQSPLTTILLMIAPVAVCVFATEHEYSVRALAWKGLYKARPAATLFTARNSTFTRQELEKSTTRTTDGHYRLQLTELFWSAGDPDLMQVYQGLPAELEGRIIREDDDLNPDRNRRRLYRVFMTCCAADAQVLGVSIQFDPADLPDLPDRTWVRVAGTVAFESRDDQHRALLEVSRIEALPDPHPKSSFLAPF